MADAKPEAPAVRELDRQMEALNATIERLEHQLSRLHSQLDPVLGSALPKESGPDVAGAPDTTLISGQIASARYRLENQCELIVEISDRLEI